MGPVNIEPLISAYHVLLKLMVHMLCIHISLCRLGVCAQNSIVQSICRETMQQRTVLLLGRPYQEQWH